MKDANDEHTKFEIIVERTGFERAYETAKEKTDEKLAQPLRGEAWNFFLLTVLYVLQAIPVRMAMAMPVILQSRGVSSADQVAYLD
ncbi:hypothetical protein V9T40_008478 [Parthenolecanium corni]|uniref:Uncharacterized protein n=1 Tax=Parthenolecanium corni TaxID=536013 RepID=A0AAN9Y7X2_9HEMI